MLMMKTSGGQKQSNRIHGFSLLELIVVSSILFILAGLLLPTISTAKQKGQSIRCLNNIRSVGFAWSLYALDYEDHLLPNVPNRPEQRWLNGNFRLGTPNNSDHTNLTLLKQSLLADYLASTAAFKCPGDKTRNIQTVDGREKLEAWVRSIGLNQWMGGVTSQIYQTYYRLSQIQAPSLRFTFINQRADTLENAFFYTGMSRLFEPAALKWNEYPARYHNGTTSIGFADGHVENHRWVTQWTPMNAIYTRPTGASPGNPDIHWLNSHATEIK
jgi:prepilin-type processing-associated H-X9-DG protein